jgi:hypothetical protein
MKVVVGWLTALLLLKSARAEGCLPGVEWNWDGSWFWAAEAYFSTEGRSGTHDPWLRGSFIASFAGMHEFNLSSGTFGVSAAFTPSVLFRWDFADGPAAKSSYSLSVSLQKDFRYSFFSELTDNYYDVWMRLEVSWPGVQKHTVDTRCAEVCEASGCRELAHSRDQLCQPPTASASPVATPSLGFPDTANLRISPVLDRSSIISMTAAGLMSAAVEGTLVGPPPATLEFTMSAAPVRVAHYVLRTSFFFWFLRS